MIKKLLLTSLSCLVLLLPPLIWLNPIAANPRQDPVETLTQYLKLLYARDFRQAYRFISADDQRLKLPSEYVRERGPFTGFSLEVARKLAALIVLRPVSHQLQGAQNQLTVAMKLPDANSIAKLLRDWDENKLNALPAIDRKNLLAILDGLISAKKLPMIEGEEKFVLVKEGSKWKVFLDWAGGAQVQFAATLPPGAQLAAEPLTKQTVARSGDLFTVGFRVTNPTAKEIVTRIVHRVEPKEHAQYLDLVECALLLPVRIRPGETQTYRSTYIIRGDLPDGTKT
ncbi:MAG: cytochrome c oxidase assembly protein, partial [Candidatus Binatia bacterium]